MRAMRYGGPAGPLAMINREPGQAWKGAAVAVKSCAGVWLVGSPPSSPIRAHLLRFAATRNSKADNAKTFNHPCVIRAEPGEQIAQVAAGVCRSACEI